MTATRRSDLLRDATALRDALAGLVRICRFADRSTVCCHDVSMTQCSALDVLVRVGPLSLNELAGELLLDKTTASRVVATLERKGYVSRRTRPDDRRSIQLRATASGRRLMERIRKEQVDELTEMVATIAPAARAGALQLLGQLTGAIASRCCDRSSGGDEVASTCATSPRSGC